MRFRFCFGGIPQDVLWRGLAVAALSGLAIVLALLAGNDSVPAAESGDSVAAKHVSVGGDPDEFDRAGQIDLIVSHQMERGRLIVRLAGSTILSVPLRAAGDGAPYRFERPLSVPSGRQPVEIVFFDRQGRLVVQKQTEGTMVAGGSVVLRVDEHSGTGDGLTLTWRTP